MPAENSVAFLSLSSFFCHTFLEEMSEMLVSQSVAHVRSPVFHPVKVLYSGEQPLQAHIHSYYELLFIEEGEGWHYLDGVKVHVVAGDLFLVAPGEIHDSSGLANTKTWTINFKVGNLDSLSTPVEEMLWAFLQPTKPQTKHFHIALDRHPQWLANIKHLYDEFQGRSLGFGEAAHALLLLLLIDTARLVTPQLQKAPSSSAPLLQKVFHYIKFNYTRQISLCDVAKVMGRSPAYLTNLVRQETGKTILNWIIEYRLAEAQFLLLTTNQSVRHIAESVGYFDTGHFIRQFQRIYGMTPQAWRQQQSLMKIS
jgi:AraC-like DNA-binding protein/quercetin dioxygenase-like cupin family protein